MHQVSGLALRSDHVTRQVRKPADQFFLSAHFSVVQRLLFRLKAGLKNLCPDIYKINKRSVVF